MDAGPRAVRIPRGEAGPSAEGASPDAGPSSAGPGGPLSVHPNEAGSVRASRLFGLFLLGLVAIDLLFLAAAVRDSASGGTDTLYVLLGVVSVAVVGVGWYVTLGQAPRAAWVERGQLVVRARTGGLHRYASGSQLRVQVLRTNPPGLLAPDETEYAELSGTGGVPRKTYLVGVGFFDFAR